MKKCQLQKSASKLMFFIDKKLRKIPMIFDIENWLWKSNFGTFCHLSITPILKIQKFSFGYVDFRQKYSSFENSTTSITITDNKQVLHTELKCITFGF